jgi:hypothetical protein
MLISGAHPLEIRFSKRVVLSSFAYALVASVYFTHSWMRLGLIFAAVTLTSLGADSFFSKSKIVCRADRLLASIVSLASPLRVILLPGAAHLQVRLAVATITVLALGTLVHSRAAPSWMHWKNRHAWWHLCSGAGLAWLALLSVHGRLHLPLLLI